MNKEYQLVIDQSTSATKLLIFKENLIYKRYDKKHRQIYPKSGWVEQDPKEIWQNVSELLSVAIKENHLSKTNTTCLSIVNQRETIITWNKETSQPMYNAIVWQCNRGSGICKEMIQAGKEALVFKKTGLRLDPYFSGSKIKWLFDHVPDIKEVAQRKELAIGTMDSWLIWQLTTGQVFATEASNACRTLLYDINNKGWDEELCDLFEVSLDQLPEIKNSDAVFGMYEGIPIRGVMADSQAALYGENCVGEGDVKVTMGTGCSLMMQLHSHSEYRDTRILTTLAWQKENSVNYALEGIIRSCGDAIHWFCDQVGGFSNVEEVCNEVLEQNNQNDIYFVPALDGLGAPFWQPDLAATFFGIKRMSSRFDLLQAVLESLIFQVKAVLDAMEETIGHAVTNIYVDGGISKNGQLMVLLATLLDKPIVIHDIEEFSALGVAKMANVAMNSLDLRPTTILPEPRLAAIKAKYQGWLIRVQQECMKGGD